MHPSKNRNPLSWRLLLATLVSSSFFLAGSTLADSQGFFSSEEEFLANADAGWVKIADNVYEKQMPNGEIVRHGFGPEAIEFFLVSAKVKKQELLELGPDGDMALYLRMLAELDHRIEGLNASMAEAHDKSVGGLASKAACNVTVGIGAGVNCSVQGGGVALASVYFIDFGPCNSANATATASGTPGTYQHETGPLTCYEGRSASAACVAVPGGCFGYAFASIDFTTCDLYQFRESFRLCPSGGIAK